MIYEQLAVCRGDDSKPVLSFGIRNVNYGQNWEEGFLNGLLKSRVIVLLISAKVKTISKV